MAFEEDPFVGDIYDGEFIVALNSILPEIWKDFTAERDTVLKIIKHNINEMDEDVQFDAKELLLKLS